MHNRHKWEKFPKELAEEVYRLCGVEMTSEQILRGTTTPEQMNRVLDAFEMEYNPWKQQWNFWCRRS